MKEKYQKITEAEINETLARSGYLLEQRVARVFSKLQYQVDYDTSFVDDLTGKVREYDIHASKGYLVGKYRKTGYFEGIVETELICECENNHQPILFFNNDRIEGDSELAYWIKHAGRPGKIYKPAEIGPGYAEEPEKLFLSLYVDDYHHYFKGPYSSQYCSFKKTNTGDWIALHEQQQHDTFDSITKAVIYKMTESKNRVTKKYRKTFLRVFYPVIVLQGEIFEAFLDAKGKHHIRKTNHMKYMRMHKRDDQIEEFLIDIVTENYLPEFLKIIDRQTHRFMKSFVKIPTLDFSIEEETKKGLW